MKSENIFEIDEKILATLFKSTGTSWRCMKSRCGSQRKSYGGKGIKYPKRWESFDCFVRDMGIRPEGKTQNTLAWAKELGINRTTIGKHFNKRKLKCP